MPTTASTNTKPNSKAETNRVLSRVHRAFDAFLRSSGADYREPGKLVSGSIRLHPSALMALREYRNISPLVAIQDIVTTGSGDFSFRYAGVYFTCIPDLSIPPDSPIITLCEAPERRRKKIP